MSEPSAAEVAKWEDLALDSQIADYMEEKDRERRGEMPDYLRGEPPEDEAPEREPHPDCPMCSGSGSIPIFLSTGEPDEMECPKCGGSG